MIAVCMGRAEMIPVKCWPCVGAASQTLAQHKANIDEVPLHDTCLPPKYSYDRQNIYWFGVLPIRVLR